VHWAPEGWLQTGKGRDRAALNLGDCSSDGLASDQAALLRFGGDSFAATDHQLAPPSGP